MGFRKRQLRLLFLVLLCIFVYTTWIIYNNQNKLSNDDFIRFHVIANSNSEEDQLLKLKVRDGVLAKINSELVEEAMIHHNAEIKAASASFETGGFQGDNLNPKTVTLDLEQSRRYIQDSLPELEAVAERIIMENGYDYTVTAELGVKWIPQKSYGNTVFPSGNYEALNITIGEGKGENWWCVLFPPLCLIGLEEPPDKEKSEDTQEVYKEIVFDHKYDELTNQKDKPETLQLKFKTLELLNNLNK